MPSAMMAKPMTNNILRKITRSLMAPMTRRIRWRKTIPPPRRIDLPASLRIALRPLSSKSIVSDDSSRTSLGTLSSIRLFLDRRFDQYRQQPCYQNARYQKPHSGDIGAVLFAQFSDHPRPKKTAEISERIDQA